MSAPPKLAPAERISLAVARFVNESALPKGLQYRYNRHVSMPWVRRLVAPRMYAENIEALAQNPGDRGVILALNHRSFFDAFVTMFAIYEGGARWPTSIFFPVRSDFFYEHPAGVAVNLLFGGGSLYPPIFRDPAKSSLNKSAVERVASLLAAPEVLVGLHPEGTRKKDDDPYTLLPAQPGVGQIALLSRATVVPVFVNGLQNSAVADIATTFRGDARRNHPIIIVVGDPIDYQDLQAKKPRAALYKQMADRMRDAITKAGAREREIREACARGAVPDDAPDWVSNMPAGRRR